MVGTAARVLASQAFPRWQGIPVGILIINLIGSFLLGCLLEVLLGRGDDIGGRRSARLLLGTGVLGGFTTYSAISLDAASLILHGHRGLGGAYALGSVVLGAGAGWAGIRIASVAAPSRTVGR